MSLKTFTMICFFMVGISGCSVKNTVKTEEPKAVKDGSHLSSNGRDISDNGGSIRKYRDTNGHRGTSLEGTPPGTLTPKQPMGTMKSFDKTCEVDPACDPIEVGK